MNLSAQRSRSVIVIIIGFAILLVLLATLYVIRLSKVSEDAGRLETLRIEYLKKELVFKMRDAAHIRAIILLQRVSVMDKEANSGLIGRLSALAEQFINARDQLLAMNLKPEQRAAWERAKPLTIAGRKAQDKAASLIIRGDTEAAANLLRDEVVPIQRQVMLELTNMLTFSTQRVNQLLNEEKQVSPRKYRQATIMVSLVMLIGVCIAFFVIRHISRSEAELVLAREEAQTANQHKSTFLANMSHELRTPLTAILGYSELLIEKARERNLDDMALDLQKVTDSGRVLLSLINDILDLSKVESGRMELDIHDFDVTALIDDITETLTPVIEKNANKLEIECSREIGTMHSDPNLLRQVLLNLLGNASKFTSAGCIRFTSKRETRDSRDWMIFSVNDNGIGISEEQLSHLFQAFYQGDASTTRKYGGTGLGLAISKRFCNMLGGELSVTSKLGVGSTFKVELPASVSEPGTEA